MFTPDFLALDYETADAGGMGSVEFWKPGFHAVSASITWTQDGNKKSHWTRNPWDMLREIADKKIPVIAHNISFEMAVTKACYPFELNWYADTMRLAALYDGGDAPEDMLAIPGEEEEVKRDGLSLSACCTRILGKADSKRQADLRIKELFPDVPVDEYGKYKPKLPETDLRAYNIGDTELTLDLFLFLQAFFEKEGYDWTIDHSLYLPECQLILDAQARGVIVDRLKLDAYRQSILTEVAQIEANFRTYHATDIAAVEDILWQKARDKYKREETKATVPRPTFNTGSRNQLEMLFVNRLGMTPKFYTEGSTEANAKDPAKKKTPSFAANHLNQFGEGGTILSTRGKRLIVAGQAGKLLELSEADGLWHMGIKPHGTKTGRGAGEGGVNGQGLSRRDIGLMSCLLAPPGKKLCSIDLSAGEPTLLTHFSQDPLYRAATFDLVGKRPEWKNGILMIGDIYLMVGSVSPFKKELEDAWKFGEFDGQSFADAWVKDDEVVKKKLKKFRQFVKMICLALGYGLGPKRMVKHAYKFGYVITLTEAKAFFNAYWDLFQGIHRFGKILGNEYKRKGYLYNAFGFRLVPEAEYKALNFFVQSGVSGLMNMINRQLFAPESPAEFVGLIHDEDLCQFAVDKEDVFRQYKDDVMLDINKQLGWSVDIRTGWATGFNFYDAK